MGLDSPATMNVNGNFAIPVLCLCDTRVGL